MSRDSGALRNIVVIGASAGGIPAVKVAIKELKPEMDLAVIVVIHVSSKSNSQNIANTFQRNSALTAKVAEHGIPLKKGHLYVAPPEHQLMVKDDRLILTAGPHENKYRPSIDVLFRSAAVNYRNKAIGIILSGLFEDGTSGMYAIKRCGGICIVQDPKEAEYSDMPRSVLNRIDVDYTLRLQEIPSKIEELMNHPLPPELPVPREIRIEAELTERMMTDINEIKKIADPSDFTCPDCGGGLWAIKNDPVHRYRCHTGHVFTERKLHDLQNENIEESVWVSIRMLEEKENLILLMARRDHEDGRIERSSFHEDRLAGIRKHIDRLRSFLSILNEDLHKNPTSVDY
ncbi:chemotaxis protein CheB [Salinimicrobium sp. CDJ15-81-2]|nr:chemotaxis protein CheB [Salinimicrobium nanhaiense]